MPSHVLAAHGEEVDAVARDRPHRAQHLDLLVAHGVGVEGDGRLHGDQREELQQVVLHHVAQRAGLLVVGRAMLDAQRLGGGDLHVVDVAAVPDRLEDAVGEAQHQQVLHGLLGQVVVDAVDLPLVEDAPRRSSLSSRALSRSWPNGFSMTMRVQPGTGSPWRVLARRRRRGAPARRRPAARTMTGNWLRRRRQVEHAVAARAAALVELVEQRRQAPEALGVVELRPGRSAARSRMRSQR